MLRKFAIIRQLQVAETVMTRFIKETQLAGLGIDMGPGRGGNGKGGRRLKSFSLPTAMKMALGKERTSFPCGHFEFKVLMQYPYTDAKCTDAKYTVEREYEV